MATTKGGLARTSTASAAKPMKVMQDYILSMKSQIAKALPTVMTPDRFTRLTLTALSTNPKLCQCTPKSFMGAMMLAAQLGLEPNTPLGQAYLIPYKNKGVLECQFQLGFKGLIELAGRNGIIVRAHVVYEHDTFFFEYGLKEDLVHKPTLIDRGKPIAYYAVWEQAGTGLKSFFVMSVEDVRAYAKKYSQAYASSYSPWTKEFDAMAKKTCIKQAFKYAPMKVEFERALATDSTIKVFDGKTDHTDMLDAADMTDYTDVEAEEVPTNVDPQTGEVIPDATKQQHDDDALLDDCIKPV